jgi:hypothetical protein
MTTQAENVEAGAKFLDEHIPNWFELIDVDLLDMSVGCSCIRGQLEDHLDPEMVDNIISGGEISYILYPVELGLVTVSVNDSWNDLQMEWIKQIEARKRQAHG